MLDAAPTVLAGALHERLLPWYATHARDLPWRRPGATPWSVLVSEVMLQQTPVIRVLPAHARWLARWPEPAALAAAPPGEAIRAWDRLGYPRRALRLHLAAGAIVERHDGAVPTAYPSLLALPGIGTYTAAAVASFAFRQRHAVLDTNVRRVLGRVLDGVAEPPVTVRVAERRRAEELLPPTDDTAAIWSVAVMELGALVCTARTPRCTQCPIRDLCAWRRSGAPASANRPRRVQQYAGTDRQARGRLLALLRASPDPVEGAALAEMWPEAHQRGRALAGLVADGLVEPLAGDTYRLPG